MTQAVAALAVAPATARSTHSESPSVPTFTVSDVPERSSSSDATLPRPARTRSKDFHFGVKPKPTLYPGATDETESMKFGHLAPAAPRHPLLSLSTP